MDTARHGRGALAVPDAQKTSDRRQLDSGAMFKRHNKSIDKDKVVFTLRQPFVQDKMTANNLFPRCAPASRARA
jgi:hypothetical protein